MWQGTWDPEGLYSTLPAIATGISGLLAGKLILSKMSQERKIIWMFSIGFVATIVGHAWGWIFPLNKNLWTSSYVVLTSGLAYMTLAASIFFVDMLGRQKFTALGRIYGANAIAVYVLAAFLAMVFYQLKIGGESLNVHFFNFFNNTFNAPKLGSLIYALIFIGINYIPAYILYKKKIFIKL